MNDNDNDDEGDDEDRRKKIKKKEIFIFLKRIFLGIFVELLNEKIIITREYL